MRDSFPRFSSHPSSEHNLLARIRANFHEAFRPIRWNVTSANGAPLHVLEEKRSPGASRAQSMSLLTHAGILSAIALIALHPSRHPVSSGSGTTLEFPPLVFPQHLLDRSPAKDPNDPGGTGGGRALLPATAGNLPPRSSIQLVKPTIPPQRESQVPIPPTILDPSANPVLPPTNNIGLPWMKDNNRSPGPGNSNTIGSTSGDTIGDQPGGPGGGGSSPDFRYRPGMTMPACVYCPVPAYTDEARETKLQGTVTVLALINAEGRAADIRITKGLGAGLDERAAESVRSWRFTPARDAARHPVATWITIEVVFRLF